MLTGCFRLWIALWALEILLTITFVGRSRLDAVPELEYGRSRQTLGHETAQQAAKRAAATVRPLLSEAPGESSPRAPDASPMQPAGRAKERVSDRARGLAILAAFRLSAWWDLAIPIIACFAAAAVDGLMVRRRRAFSFASTNTAVYNAAGYLLICAAMAPLLCLTAPVVMPAATPLVSALATGGAIWLLCAHLPGPSTVIGAQA